MLLDAVASPDSTVPALVATLPARNRGISEPWVPSRESSSRINSTSSGSFALCGLSDPFDRDFSITGAQPIAWSTLTIARAFRPAVERLLSYTRLPENWDNDGGQAPRLSTVAKAFGFLAEIAQYAKVPRLFVVGDGEIGFSWEGASGYAQVSFHDDSEIVVLAKFGDDLNVRGVFNYDSLPRDKVAQIIKQL